MFLCRGMFYSLIEIHQSFVFIIWEPWSRVNSYSTFRASFLHGQKHWKLNLCTKLYRAHAHSHSHTVWMSVFPSNPSVRRGITLWEHSKPVHLENNTAVIHVAITPLNIKHTFTVEFPAVSHCIMAESRFERSASTEHSKKKLILSLHPSVAAVSLHMLHFWIWRISCAWQNNRGTNSFLL